MRKFVSLVALAALAGVAQAQDISAVNGYRSDARIFNDFAASSLTINGVNRPVQDSQPLAYGPVHFVENFAQGEPGNFANKHVAWLSYDGGATRAVTNSQQSFSIDFDVRITAPGGSPRKEAGMEVHQPRDNGAWTDEGQLLIASDGEVAVFGGSMPFTGLGNVYTLNTTAHVKWEYFAPGVQDPTKGAYRLTFTDAVTGVHSSGIKIWGAEFDGVAGHTNAFFGFKSQNQRNPFLADSSDMLYSNVSIIPAPAALGLIGLAGLAGTRRRR